MRCALACLLVCGALAVVLPAPGDASLKQLPQQRQARAELYRTLEKPMQTPLCTRGRDHAALAVLELPSLGVNVLVGESLAVRGELGLAQPSQRAAFLLQQAATAPQSPPPLASTRSITEPSEDAPRNSVTGEWASLMNDWDDDGRRLRAFLSTRCVFSSPLTRAVQTTLVSEFGKKVTRTCSARCDCRAF